MDVKTETFGTRTKKIQGFQKLVRRIKNTLNKNC